MPACTPWQLFWLELSCLRSADHIHHQCCALGFALPLAPARGKEQEQQQQVLNVMNPSLEA
jgi:hypothetical protein